MEREVCREVYAPVPVTPEDTGVLDDMGNPEEALVELKKGLDVLVSVYGHEHRTWRTASII